MTKRIFSTMNLFLLTIGVGVADGLSLSLNMPTSKQEGSNNPVSAHHDALALTSIRTESPPAQDRHHREAKQRAVRFKSIPPPHKSAPRPRAPSAGGSMFGCCMAMPREQLYVKAHNDEREPLKSESDLRHQDKQSFRDDDGHDDRFEYSDDRGFEMRAKENAATPKPETSHWPGVRSKMTKLLTRRHSRPLRNMPSMHTLGSWGAGAQGRLFRTNSGATVAAEPSPAPIPEIQVAMFKNKLTNKICGHCEMRFCRKNYVFDQKINQNLDLLLGSTVRRRKHGAIWLVSSTC